MRDLAALATIGLFLAGLFANGVSVGHAVRTARADATVTLTATR